MMFFYLFLTLIEDKCIIILLQYELYIILKIKLKKFLGLVFLIFEMILLMMVFLLIMQLFVFVEKQINYFGNEIIHIILTLNIMSDKTIK